MVCIHFYACALVHCERCVFCVLLRIVVVVIPRKVRQIFDVHVQAFIETLAGGKLILMHITNGNENALLCIYNMYFRTEMNGGHRTGTT